MRAFRFLPVLLVIILLGTVTEALPQPYPDTLWTHAYGGTGGDAARSVQQTSGGGYIIAGYTNSFGAGSVDFYLVKTDALGNPIWTRTYGGAGWDEAHCVLQTPDGGYMVAGYSGSFGDVHSDFYLVRTNGSGDTVWTRTYGGASLDEANSICQTSDGGYAIAGKTTSYGTGAPYLYNFWLVKINALGEQIWAQAYGGELSEEAYSVQQMSDGGYLLVGYIYYSWMDTDFYVVKTDSAGNLLWTRTFGGTGNEIAYAINRTMDGGYILSGGTNSYGGSGLFLEKMDSSGDSVWAYTYGGIYGQNGRSIVQTTDGGYIVAGTATPAGASNTDFILVKVGGLGNTHWVRTFGGFYSEVAYSVQQTTDGGYIIAGNTNSFGQSDPSNPDIWLVKTGPDQNLRVLSPNGGEIWRVLEPETVRWNGAYLGGNVSIDLNRNYPIAEWEVLLSGTENDGEEVISVMEPPSEYCRIRVSLLEDTLLDISDSDFSIVLSQGLLALVRASQPTTPLYSWDAGTVDSAQAVRDTFRLKNFGSEALIVYHPSEPASAEFSIATDCPGVFTLAPDEMSTCEVMLTFDPVNNGTFHDTLLIMSSATNQQGGYVRFPLVGQQVSSAASEFPALPHAFALHPNRPNPFNPMTQIAYDLPRASVVSLKVFDVLGRKVVTLVEGIQPAGSYSVIFNGSELASGVYLCRFQAGHFAATLKMVLLK